jgi:hypothetical protein
MVQPEPGDDSGRAGILRSTAASCLRRVDFATAKVHVNGLTRHMASIAPNPSHSTEE